MTLRQKIEVMEAFERGEEIEQCERLFDNWYASPLPSWNWKEFDYRIKPKPKQVVVIEKWLFRLKGTERYAIEEASNEKLRDCEIDESCNWQKVKLLDTYEVEI